MSKEKIRVYKQGCDPTEADDRTLPYTSFLVEYVQDGITKFDIVFAGKKVDLFDHYYDQYKKDFINFTQPEGRINPRIGNDPTATTDKK